MHWYLSSHASKSTYMSEVRHRSSATGGVVPVPLLQAVDIYGSWAGKLIILFADTSLHSCSQRWRKILPSCSVVSSLKKTFSDELAGLALLSLSIHVWCMCLRAQRSRERRQDHRRRLRAPRRNRCTASRSRHHLSLCYPLRAASAV